MDRIGSIGSRVRTGAIALALGAFAMATPAAAETYVFDKELTSVLFSWNHMGLSRQTARFLDCEGTLEFDPAQPERGAVAVVIKTASLSTGNPQFDKNLRSADFFNAGVNPDITFRSTGVRVTGRQTGEVTGDLTISGITKPVLLYVTWNYTGEHPMAKLNPAYLNKVVSGFSAVAKLNRSEWGLDRVIPFVSDEIQISIEAELTRKEP
ncbi:MAG: YceI family protein [Hyphomicrobiaceae bacterium]